MLCVGSVERMGSVWLLDVHGPAWGHTPHCTHQIYIHAELFFSTINLTTKHIHTITGCECSVVIWYPPTHSVSNCQFEWVHMHAGYGPMGPIYILLCTILSYICVLTVYMLCVVYLSVGAITCTLNFVVVGSWPLWPSKHLEFPSVSVWAWGGWV